MSLIQILRVSRQAVQALWTSWVRSSFIIGAIGLGIASLTIILASMEGANLQAAEMAAKFGPTSVNIFSGGVVDEPFELRPMTLTWSDVQGIEKSFPNVERVNPLLILYNVIVKSKDKRHIADNLVGVGSWHGISWGWYLSDGRDFTDEDVQNSESVCFIGSITAERLFGAKSPLGEIIVVDEVPLTIIGIHSPLGLVNGNMEFDDRVTVPITTLIRRFNLSREHLAQVRVTFSPANTPEMMAHHVENLRGLLRHMHRIPGDAPDDFTLMTMQDILQFVDLLKGSIVLFLGIVAVAAMVAGGVTQANLFYLAVADRSREIGLKKALGASNNFIFLQFLMESAMLACCGAVLGMLIGSACSYILGNSGLLTIHLSPKVFITGFAVACAIGCIFGIRPARVAASMPPVSALKGVS